MAGIGNIIGLWLCHSLVQLKLPALSCQPIQVTINQVYISSLQLFLSISERRKERCYRTEAGKQKEK